MSSKRDYELDGYWLYRGKQSKYKPVVVWSFGRNRHEEWERMWSQLKDRGLDEAQIYKDTHTDDDYNPVRLTKKGRAMMSLYEEIPRLADMSPEIIDAMKGHYETEDLYKQIKEYQADPEAGDRRIRSLKRY
jgi:hypothetical protein